MAKFHTDATLRGTFALKFYDLFGEDYTTGPIILEDYTQDHIPNIPALQQPGPSSCPSIVQALEDLPSRAIDPGTLRCEEKTFGVGSAAECGVTYSLTFRGNPGYLKQIEVDYYLDGQRPTIFNHYGKAGVNVTTMVYTNNDVGDVDYFATPCEGLTVRTKFLDDGELDVNKWGYLDGLSSGGKYRDFMQCIGDSDGIELNNIEVYNVDYGGKVLGSTSTERMSGNPHLVKFVPKDRTDIYDRSRMGLVWVSQVVAGTNYGGTSLTKAVWLANPPDEEAQDFVPYVTDGVAEVVFVDDDGDEELEVYGTSEPRVVATFERGSNYIYTSHDVGCETADAKIHPCLDKGDMIYLFDANWGRSSYKESDNSKSFGAGDAMYAKNDLRKTHNWYKYNNYNPNTGIPYTIKKIYKAKPTPTTFTKVEDRYRIIVDKGINWGNENTTQAEDPDGDGIFNTGFVQLIKFSPATTGNYQFHSECSHRGKCDFVEAQCECDPGYGGLACEIEDTLAM